MAAAAAKHEERDFPPREGGRWKPRGETRCGTGAGPGAAPHTSERRAELPAPATTAQRPASLVPSSARHSDRGPCPQPGGGQVGKASAHETNLQLSGQRGTPCPAAGGPGQLCLKVAGPAPGHCSMARGTGKGCRPISTVAGQLLRAASRCAGGIKHASGTDTEQQQSVCTRINVFVNSAQVRGESLAGQSYRRLVTLHFSPRASAKFGFFSIVPLNLKIKNKQ